MEKKYFSQSTKLEIKIFWKIIFINFLDCSIIMKSNLQQKKNSQEKENKIILENILGNIFLLI